MILLIANFRNKNVRNKFQNPYGQSNADQIDI